MCAARHEKSDRKENENSAVFKKCMCFGMAGVCALREGCEAEM